jgi:hypothetical protein
VAADHHATGAAPAVRFGQAAERRCDIYSKDQCNAVDCRQLVLIGGRFEGECVMPCGDKSAYTDRQKRMAAHIEEGYERRGIGEKEAERRAWSTVNKETHGGQRSGSGRGKPEDHGPARKGGRLGGAAQAKRPA